MSHLNLNLKKIFERELKKKSFVKLIKSVVWNLF